MMDSVLGIDLGTSSAKVAVYSQAGDLLASAETPYLTSYGKPGQVEHNPAHWLAALGDALRRLPVRHVQAIGLSAHAPAIVPTDGRGTPLLSQVPIWNDLRPVSHGRALLRQVGADALWTGPGAALAAYYPHLHWLATQHPATIQKARWLLSPKDLIGFWLTGEAKSDPSSGAGAAAWRGDLLALCGVSADKLPSLQQPTAITGTLQKKRAAALGLPPGIPVITGLNDGAAASLAANALQVGDVIITLGTNGVVRGVVGAPPAGAARLATGVFCWSYVNGRWIVGGHTRLGANVLGWLATLLDAVTGVEDVLELAAETGAGAGGLLFLPYLLGRGTPYNDDQASGTWHGLTLNSTRQDICRAALEGITFALSDARQALPPSPPNSSIHITGGGARSPLWTQIIADVFNQPVRVYSEQPALGAAILAAAGVGMYAGVEQAAAALVRLNREQQPSAANHALYAQVQARFATLRG